MREYYRENSFRFPSLPGCVASHATSITSITSLRYVRYVLDYAVIAVAFRRCSRCYIEGGFSAAVISLPLNNTQRGAAQRRIARACGIIQCWVPWSVKRLICCAMAVTHLTISVKKTCRSEQCWCRWTTGERIDARKYDTPGILWTLRCTFLSRLDVTVARSISSSVSCMLIILFQ